MADAKFRLFSKGLVQYLLESIDKMPRLSRYGIPSYKKLEDMADNSTAPVLLDLTERQQQDYETLRTNLKGLLKQYRSEYENKPPISYREVRIYDKLNFWLKEYVMNADLKAIKKKKPDF
jgi:hypothetical protein